MSLPQSNAEGYADSSVMTHASKMRGKLLLVHGLIDENVHFRHTARLINALIAHRKRYDLVLFPCERHSPHRMQDKIYMEDIIMDFFRQHLLAPTQTHDAAIACTGGMRSGGRNSSPVDNSSNALKMTANL